MPYPWKLLPGGVHIVIIAIPVCIKILYKVPFCSRFDGFAFPEVNGLCVVDHAQRAKRL